MKTKLIKITIFIIAVVIGLAIPLSHTFAQTIIKPELAYLSDFSFSDTNSVKLSGPARVVSFDGRKGLNMTSIHSVLRLKSHNLKEKKGTLTMWVMPMEALSTFDSLPKMRISNSLYFNYNFLSDCPNPQDFRKSNFKLSWTPRWHPSLIAQFAKGTFYEEAFNMPHKAVVSVSHFAFKARTWYQLSLTWDYEKELYVLYVNGILVGREDQYRRTHLDRDSINTSLYLGNTDLCYGDIKFFDHNFSEEEVYSQFRKEAVHFDQTLEDELLYTYEGKGRKSFDWKPDTNWQKKFSLSLTNPSDMDSLYVQGNPVDLRITKEGLLIETVNKEYTGALLDSQVYVWSGKPFEGDLYVEYEFKVMRPAGLSLLMVQASGMNREDFMADYPLRKGGRMTTVYGEDVRNYHWEYYREMADIRNDVANSALMKNPYLYPLSFGSLNTPVEKDKWQKLQFLQIGNKLIGAINGIVMVEYTDNAFSNNGPVYDFGRIAIRCMLRSKLMFRNLKVYNRETIRTTKIIAGEVARKKVS